MKKARITTRKRAEHGKENTRSADSNGTKAILEQPKPRYLTGQRNKMIIQLMLNTGLRLDEGCSLRWKDIDLNTGKLMVRQGKESKDRALWIGESDLEAFFVKKRD